VNLSILLTKRKEIKREYFSIGEWINKSLKMKKNLIFFNVL